MQVDRSELEAREQAFRERCAGCKLPLTPQRLAIFRVLAAIDCHPTADELFRRVRPRLPSLALGTVYRTLDWLEAHGLIARVQSPGEPARFDANLGAHHHLICTRCRRVVDFTDKRLDTLLPHGRRLR